MNRLVTCLLLGVLWALAAPARAATWLGVNFPAGGTRSWNIGANWDLGAVPPDTDIDNFGLTGDGGVTLDGPAVGGKQTAAGMTLEPWVGYIFSPGTVNPASSLQLSSPAGPATLLVGDNIRATSWTDYFIGPQPTAPAPWAVQVGAPEITADLLAPMGLNILFQNTGANDSSLLLASKVTGSTTIGMTGTTQNFSVWVTKDNKASGSGPTINYMGASGAVHFVDGSNLGSGHMQIDYSGTLALHTSSNLIPQPVVYQNTSVGVSVGNFFADRSYQSNPLNTFSGGMNAFWQTDGTFMVDNPTGNAQANFTGNNGFNFGIYYVDGIGIGIGPNAGSHTITVTPGVMTGGRAGFLVSSVPVNGLDMSLTTVLGDTTGAAPGSGNYFDSGNMLVKNGLGVLQLYIAPLNDGRLFHSTGVKRLDAGVLRLSDTVPAGTGQILINSPSAAVGVASDRNVASIPTLALAAGLTTPGQSGAFDLDLNLAAGNGTQNIAEDFFNTNANKRTALRVGSSDTSGNANTTGIITPSTDANTFFLGGGGGTLTIKSVLSDHNGGGTALEMGTSGQLLPGRIILSPIDVNHPNTYTGATLIRAGTLQLSANGSVIGGSSSLSVGTYSTGFNGIYQGAPAGYFNGFGQLLLDPNTYYFGPVNNRTLDGGAVGWTGDYTLTALPGVWGNAA